MWHTYPTILQVSANIFHTNFFFWIAQRIRILLYRFCIVKSRSLKNGSHSRKKARVGECGGYWSSDVPFLDQKQLNRLRGMRGNINILRFPKSRLAFNHKYQLIFLLVVRVSLLSIFDRLHQIFTYFNSSNTKNKSNENSLAQNIKPGKARKVLIFSNSAAN